MTDPLTAPLPAPDRRGRIGRLRERLDGDVIVVSTAANVEWLTGFAGSLGWVVVGPDEAVLVTDGRYDERAESDVARSGADIAVRTGSSRGDIRRHVVSTARAAGSTVRAEASDLTHAAWLDLATELNLVDAAGTVEALRRSKDDWELARIGRAAAIADTALAEVARTIIPGLTEVDIRTELEYRMRLLGAEGPSYDTIVASGPLHAARPHHAPVSRAVEEGDWVIIDVGALVDGYHSDLTRSYVVGDPTDEQLELYGLVAHAQAVALDAYVPGIAGGDLDDVSRQVFKAAGRGEWVLHGSGHGVGLRIHEAPWVVPGSSDVLTVGDVVTCEPGLYRCGVGGVRIEDLVTVTSDGHRNLSASPKESPCLPSPRTT